MPRMLEISELLNFKFFRGSMPPAPPVLPPATACKKILLNSWERILYGFSGVTNPLGMLGPARDLEAFSLDLLSFQVDYTGKLKENALHCMYKTIVSSSNFL